MDKVQSTGASVVPCVAQEFGVPLRVSAGSVRVRLPGKGHAQDCLAGGDTIPDDGSEGFRFPEQEIVDDEVRVTRFGHRSSRLRWADLPREGSAGVP